MLRVLYAPIWDRMSADSSIVFCSAARRMLHDDGVAISLIKPQYEAGVERLREGVLPSEHLDAVLQAVKGDIAANGFQLIELIESPIRGGEGNVEMLAYLRPA